MWSCCASHVTEWGRRIQCKRSRGQDKFSSVCQLLKGYCRALVHWRTCCDGKQTSVTIPPCKYNLFIVYFQCISENIFLCLPEQVNRLMSGRSGIFCRDKSLKKGWHFKHRPIMGIKIWNQLYWSSIQMGNLSLFLFHCSQCCTKAWTWFQE